MSKNNEIELLPCPICGEKEFEVRGIPYQLKCSCGLAFCTGDADLKVFTGKWNTRKPMEEMENQLVNAAYWTISTFDEDGYSNDDSQEVVDLQAAIDIVRSGGM